jgi:hypothetical protein
MKRLLVAVTAVAAISAVASTGAQAKTRDLCWTNSGLGYDIWAPCSKPVKLEQLPQRAHIEIPPLPEKGTVQPAKEKGEGGDHGGDGGGGGGGGASR